MDEVLNQIGTFLGSLDWLGGVIKLLVMVVILTFTRNEPPRAAHFCLSETLFHLLLRSLI